MTIRDEPRDHIDDKACDTPVPGMLKVADIFQLIVHSLDPRTLPQEQFVPQTPHTMLPVLADFGEACQPWAEQDVMQGLGEVAAVTKELPPQACGQCLAKLTVLDGARRHAKGPQCALVIDDHRQCEAVDPAHRGLPSRGQALKDSVRGKAMMVTHRKRRRGHAGHPCATTLTRRQRAAQRHQRPGQEFDKAMVAHQLGARGVEGSHDIHRIVVLKRARMTPMNIDQKCQYLAECEGRLAWALTLTDVQQASGIYGLKSLAASVHSAEDSQQVFQRGSW